MNQTADVSKRVTVAALGAVLAWACGAEPMGEADGFDAADDRQSSDQATLDEGDTVLKARFPAGSGCSTAEREDIATAESVAIIELAAIALDADDLVNNPSRVGLLQLQNFFGVESVADRRFVTDTYENILAVVSDTDYLCLNDGDVVVNRASGQDILCGDASGATASTDRGTLTRLCPDFFAFNNSIIQAGVIIHELSHQTRTAPPPGVPTDDLDFPSIHSAASYASYANKCLALQCL